MFLEKFGALKEEELLDFWWKLKIQILNKYVYATEKLKNFLFVLEKENFCWAWPLKSP